MKTELLRVAVTASASRKLSHVLAAATLVILGSSPAYAEVAQSPLYLGGGNVPGNLTLVPSVEWPTINSVANLGNYDSGRTYLGYFDPNKCYLYQYSSTESERHFYPVGVAVNRLCSNQWSGNFMNWAATQTIDPFRWVLTGGYRVKDAVGETWLEKARHTGQGGTTVYPNRRLPGSGDQLSLVGGATPLTANWIRMRIQGLGNKMRFRLADDDVDENVTAYNPAQPLLLDRAYEVSIRVKVCVPGLLEANCRTYSGGYKPEGLIQQYADELRIGVFGYLNDPDQLRDGGVLRARQKFVGQTMIVPGEGETANTNAEWDANTGVLLRNPDPADASDTAGALGISILDSGALNYLNKFGQMTNALHKSKDPVSELYYTALRYLKNQGNVAQYTDIPGATGANAAQAADGFPVITDWDDPIQYACQTNVILGIGDVNTHRDKNLPGSSANFEEPSKPASVSGDSTVNVVTATAEVASFEGISINTPFSGRENSAYIAGLAWDAHTRDLRPDDLPGTQTVSTHWVDVLEAETLEPAAQNQYYLATKYGGFRVPEDFDPDAHTGALPLDWWHSNGETLVSFGVNANPAGDSYPRPDNYYLAGEATDMVESLTTAFARISAEVRSSASSVAANSTRLGSDTAVFQAAFDSTNWSGDLQAFRINTDGTISATESWGAADRLDLLTDFNIASRKVFTVTPPVSAGGGSLVSGTGADFLWTDLAGTQQDALRQTPGAGPLVSVTEGQDRLAYLRGVRALEQPDGSFRTRGSRLGDIVNSDPQFVHKQDFGYALLDQSEAFSGMNLGAAYQTFRQSGSYQSRPPMVVVAANDGMLHGFNAGLDGSGGEELFAFVPNAAFENLYELTLPDYAHRFYVDGSPRIADAWVGSSWRTIAVGVTGAGGRSVFALDITNPASMSKSSVMWEFNHPSLGYTIGQPAVAPLPNGEFGVVVTSGYDTGEDDGVIWILDPADGSIIHSITLPDSGELGPPLVVDLNSDRVSDRIYVGDTDGNLWRLDLVGATVSNWQAPSGLRSGSTPVPLYVARDDDGLRQAITAPLSSAFNDKGLHTLFFGTGSFYRIDDNVVPDDPSVDTFYGIIDRGEPITARSELLEQEILAEVTVSGTRVRGVTANEIQSGDSGWYLDLEWSGSYGGPGPAGERVVSRAAVRGDRVIFATLIPNPDPCAFGGDSWVMELNTFDGGRLEYAVFDLNNDAEFDDDDWITITDENGNEIRIPPSAIAPDINIIKTPAIISGFGENQDEVKVMSGSSGQLIRITEKGGVGIGRQSWRQLR
ncbi:MAG: PilC/PilY family type IV pilus protein [Woeseia sp.]